MLEFEVGGGQVIKGFDDAILGMNEGEEKQFSISPADAYGEHDPTLIQKVPRETFPQDIELIPGLLFEAGLSTGEKVPCNDIRSGRRNHIGWLESSSCWKEIEF